MQWKLREQKFCSHSCAAIFHRAGPKRLKKMLAAAKKKAELLRGTGKKYPYVKRDGRHEHRAVAEKKMGRKLRKGEIVHHKNNNGKDNRPCNIVVFKNQAVHMAAHRADLEAGKRRKKCR